MGKPVFDPTPQFGKTLPETRGQEKGIVSEAPVAACPVPDRSLTAAFKAVGLTLNRTKDKDTNKTGSPLCLRHPFQSAEELPVVCLRITGL